MKVWMASVVELPVVSPTMPPGTLLPCYYDPATSAVYYGDDTTGDKVSMQPDGTIGRSPHSNPVGDWERTTIDVPNHCFQYLTWQNAIPSGIGFRVRFCAR